MHRKETSDSSGILAAFSAPGFHVRLLFLPTPFRSPLAGLSSRSPHTEDGTRRLSSYKSCTHCPQSALSSWLPLLAIPLSSPSIIGLNRRCSYIRPKTRNYSLINCQRSESARGLSRSVAVRYQRPAVRARPCAYIIFIQSNQVIRPTIKIYRMNRTLKSNYFTPEL